MGVSLVSVSVCLVSGDDTGAVNVGALLEAVESLVSMCRRTSSFMTRPSLPVPVISRMSILCVLRRPRTAGVASEACFDFGASGIGVDGIEGVG